MIAAAQETRLQGFKIFDTCDCGVFYSCNNESKLLLTCYMIHKEVKIPMLDFEPKDEHIWYLRLKSKILTSLLFLCVHQLRMKMIQIKVPPVIH